MNQVEIRLPELTGGTEAEQLRKIQSYLITLAQQLQYAFDGTSREQTVSSWGSTVQEESQQEQQQPSFSSIKSLILKSAQITEYFTEEVSRRLSGRYVAQSQFGTFTRQTEQKITQNAEELRQEFSNVQQIETDLEGMKSALAEVNASIRTGLLYEDDLGFPVYGVEIGQQTRENGVIRFRKFARLTSEKLAFYDANDIEVAYISDRKLHITWAEAVSVSADTLSSRQLQLGEYSWQLGQDGHLSLR